MAVVHGLSCSTACGIFVDQGLNLCPLHWQKILIHCTTREVVAFLICRLGLQKLYLPTKVCILKTMVFPVVVYRCERWTIKKAEDQRTDAFEL